MSVRILVGDCRARLAELPAQSVHCCVTSPPYWGLRDYGIPPSVWGGRTDCEHQWDSEAIATEVGRGNWAQATNGRGEVQGDTAEFREPIRGDQRRGTCRLCGAWLGVLGLEPSPDLFTEHMVEVFEAVRRVLRDDGTCWVNLGDTFGSNSAGTRTQSGFPRNRQRQQEPTCGSQNYRGNGIKDKDLCGIPWRVAFALQAAGWYLRSDIVWAKPNPMPESVRDRPTRSHEYVFLLAKSPRYYYDLEAIRQPPSGITGGSHFGGPLKEAKADQLVGSALRTQNRAGTPEDRRRYMQTGANARTVWMITPRAFKEAHFATFPVELPERCIKAGTSERGCCPRCGTPWERIVERSGGISGDWTEKERADANGQCGTGNDVRRESARAYKDGSYQVQTVGWQPACGCDAGEPVPCTALDPFGGSGTTALAADRLGRDSILCEMNLDYCRMAKRRLLADAPMLAKAEIIQ